MIDDIFINNLRNEIHRIIEFWLGRNIRIIWSNLFWQKHGVEKMAQLNLKNVQYWGVPGRIPVADYSICEKFLSCV